MTAWPLAALAALALCGCTEGSTRLVRVPLRDRGPDGAAVDAGPTDGALDRGLDAALDLGLPDAALDLSLPDAALPDVALPDAAPDAAPADGGPPPETCNRLDDDGDGRVDEHAGAPCVAFVGRCQVQGTQRCVAGQPALFCEAPPPPAEAERCNGRDDDCDGAIDEAAAQPCGPQATCARTACGCEAGYANANGRWADGCEAGCGPPAVRDGARADVADVDLGLAGAGALLWSAGPYEVALLTAAAVAAGEPPQALFGGRLAAAAPPGRAVALVAVQGAPTAGGLLWAAPDGWWLWLAQPDGWARVHLTEADATADGTPPAVQAWWAAGAPGEPAQVGVVALVHGPTPRLTWGWAPWGPWGTEAPATALPAGEAAPVAAAPAPQLALWVGAGAPVAAVVGATLGGLDGTLWRRPLGAGAEALAQAAIPPVIALAATEAAVWGATQAPDGQLGWVRWPWAPLAAPQAGRLDLRTVHGVQVGPGGVGVVGTGDDAAGVWMPAVQWLGEGGGDGPSQPWVDGRNAIVTRARAFGAPQGPTALGWLEVDQVPAQVRWRPIRCP